MYLFIQFISLCYLSSLEYHKLSKTQNSKYPYLFFKIIFLFFYLHNTNNTNNKQQQTIKGENSMENLMPHNNDQHNLSKVFLNVRMRWYHGEMRCVVRLVVVLVVVVEEEVEEVWLL